MAKIPSVFSSFSTFAAWNLRILLTFNYLFALSASETVLRSNTPNSTTAARVEKCENDTLNQCWAQLPPFPDQGIPSSPAGVTKACLAFETGMTCVNNWTKRCLGEDARKKIQDSVRGAHEAFTFLCRDQTFQKEFLSHADCYKKISFYWDDCANRFISTLKSLDPPHYENPTNLCCIRREFKRCVSQVAHHHCSKDASIFLLRMAETLVRTALRGNTPKPEMCESHPVQQECDRRGGGSRGFQESQIIIILLSFLPMFIRGAEFDYVFIYG